jgi:hypothetical protein
MVLVAATGGGLGLVRFYTLRAITSIRDPNEPLLSSAARTVFEWSVAVLPCVIMWALALLVIRFRRPRPTLPQLTRQPGVVACGSIALTVLVRGVGLLVLGLRPAVERAGMSDGYWDRLPIQVTTELGANLSLAVAASWLLLKMSGRWRSEPSLCDRFGLVVGIYLISMSPLYCWWPWNDLYISGS